MKTIRHISIIAVLVSMQVMAFVSVVLAASGGGEHAAESDPMGVVWKVVNFAIIVVLIVKFGGPPVKNFLRERTEGIQKSLDDAREAKELARKALDEVEERLRTKDKEIEEMLASAKQSGEKEREALVQEGARMSEKLLEQAKTNIEFELNQAREAIKAEAVEIAMELAEKKLRDKLSDEDRKRLFEEALSQLEGRN
jgi:F-type H+-transporting ATPase subunit b